MTATDPVSNHRWLKPFIQLLRQGVSPEKIALTIALGIILGVTPVLGSTMLLCTFAAILFRLNLPAIQLVNGVVYPLQFVLLIPFYRLGARMFRADASTISLGGVTALIREGVGHTVRTLWVVTMQALLAWLALGMVALADLLRFSVPAVIWKIPVQLEWIANDDECSPKIAPQRIGLYCGLIPLPSAEQRKRMPLMSSCLLE
jgi:uncharacterized protein (DUF2062 family)